MLGVIVGDSRTVTVTNSRKWRLSRYDNIAQWLRYTLIRTSKPEKCIRRVNYRCFKL